MVFRAAVAGLLKTPRLSGQGRPVRAARLGLDREVLGAARAACDGAKHWAGGHGFWWVLSIFHMQIRAIGQLDIRRSKEQTRN